MQKYSLSLEEILDFEKIRVDYKKMPMQKNIKKCFTCTAGKYSFFISSLFQIRPCFLFREKEFMFDAGAGNMQDSINELKQTIARYRSKNIKNCDYCESYKLCNMCTARAHPVRDATGKITDFEASSEHCMFVTKKHELLKYDNAVGCRSARHLTSKLWKGCAIEGIFKNIENNFR